MRLRLEANKTADGVLALEKAVAALQHEAKEVDGEFQSKVSEAEADAAMIQEVGPWLPQRAHFSVDFWAKVCLTAFIFLSPDYQGSSRCPYQGWPGWGGGAGDVGCPGGAAASDE